MIGWEKSFPLIEGAQKNYCLVHLPAWTQICSLPFSGRILPSLLFPIWQNFIISLPERICYCGFGCSLWIIANSYNFTLTPFLNVFIDLSIISLVPGNVLVTVSYGPPSLLPKGLIFISCGTKEKPLHLLSLLAMLVLSTVSVPALVVWKENLIHFSITLLDVSMTSFIRILARWGSRKR